MSYRFCLGPSGSGKSSLIHKEIIERANRFLDHPECGEPARYYVIVPDQFTMQTQRELVEENSRHGIMNIDVLSFSRLSYRIFEEVGGDNRAVLGDTGKSLILRKIAGQIRDQLMVLGSSLSKPGMISEVKSQLSEFLQYDIGETEMEELIGYAGSHRQNALKNRLLDLRTLFRAFNEYRQQNYITSEETLDIVSELIPHSEKIRESVIVFDGFTGFTPVQYKVLAGLLRCAREVIFCLTFDEDDGPSAEEVMATGTIGSEQLLFALSRKTIRNISKISSQSGVRHGKDIRTDRNAGIAWKKSGCPVLPYLEQHIFRHPAHPFTDKTNERNKSLRIVKASDPEEEIRQACILIRQLSAQYDYDYRDFAIVTGDLEGYADLLEKQMTRYEIPFYLDRTRPVMENVLTEMIRSALNLRIGGFSYQAVFRFLRCGVTDLTPQETDLLENYCLSHGISSLKKWLTPFDENVEVLRKRFLDEIEPLIRDRLQEDVKAPVTAGERADILLEFLERDRTEEKTAAIAAGFAETGDPSGEMEYSQIFEAVTDLLRQIQDLIGDEKISAREFSDLIDAGLQEIRLGTIPQKADQVLVGDIERTRLKRVRVLLFVGVNDGIIPKAVRNTGLISDPDRELLARSGIEMAPGPREKIYTQRLYLYLNMTKPSDLLILSYAQTSRDARSLRPSYLIAQLKKLFPDAEEEIPEEESALRRLTGTKESLTFLSEGLRRFADGEYIGEPEKAKEFRMLYRWFADYSANAAAGRNAETGSGKNSTETSAHVQQAFPEETIRKILTNLTDNAFRHYRPRNLAPGTARQLYGNVLTGGISRMETAAQCYLRQFLQYGLRLRERDEFVFQPVDSGTLMHESLQRFSGALSGKGLTWRSFDEETGRKLISEALDKTAAEYHDLIAYSTARTRYSVTRILKILVRTINTLQFQLQQGSFEPAAYEMSFGQSGREDAIRFDLGHGRELRLTGRIDRLDLCRENETLYIKILDYKSGRHVLDPEQIRRGLQLQLPVYMEEAMKIARMHGEKDVIPSAMLYYQMDDPVIDRIMPPETGNTSDTSPDPGYVERIQREIRKKLRPTGLVNTDRTSLFLLDHDLASSSLVIPAGITRRNELSASSKVYTPDEYREMTDLVQKKMCEMGSHILDGDVAAEPARIDAQRTACDFCPFQNVCGFDRSIPGYGFRTD